MGYRRWSPERVQKLKDLWDEGFSTIEIAERMETSHTAITQFMSRNRKALGFEPRRSNKRDVNDVPRSVYSDSFEKLWYGSVPRGHWSITKPWRIEDVKAA